MISTQAAACVMSDEAICRIGGPVCSLSSRSATSASGVIFTVPIKSWRGGFGRRMVRVILWFGFFLRFFGPLLRLRYANYQ